MYRARTKLHLHLSDLPQYLETFVSTCDTDKEDVVGDVGFYLSSGPEEGFRVDIMPLLLPLPTAKHLNVALVDNLTGCGSLQNLLSKFCHPDTVPAFHNCWLKYAVVKFIMSNTCGHDGVLLTFHIKDVLWESWMTPLSFYSERKWDRKLKTWGFECGQGLINAYLAVNFERADDRWG